MTERNWAGNISYSADEVAHPASRAELRDLVRAAPAVRVLGSRHSFNRITDTAGLLVSTADLPAHVDIDEDRRIARVSGGMRYGEVAGALQNVGWALGNLASLPHISVAGAIATGTHGSGDRNRSLAGSVSGLEILTASGDIRMLRRGEPGFEGAVVSLGALGVVLDVELDIEPTYEVAQTVYERVAWDDVLADLTAVTSLGYSVSLFTTWRDPALVDQVWVKARTDAAPAPERLLGALPASGPRHPLPGVSAESCTVQGGVPGPWLDRLAHFRLEFTPSQGEELQTEYFVARSDAADAIRALRPLADRIAPLLFVNEVRTIAADELWLSGAQGRETVGLHFTWRPDQPAVEALLPAIEEALAPFAPRPHWGKVFTMPADVIRSRYERWDDVATLRADLDPRRVFVNPFLEALGF
ncbi:FAD-binding protein [Microbacterium caowuchunii]|uniref:FAD-binding protein n=1 Tax=Microbacterium caowuchunii TaxID=2614638 RepID=UPI001243CB78|nr:FAD-binding protein [Microbacterium caowuchunii]QEV99694.1 FAD-binding protein [Microbacterium caowuchunii]